MSSTSKEDSEAAEKSLPVEQWDAPPKTNSNKTRDQNGDTPKKSLSVGEKKRLSYEEIIESLEERMKSLLQREVFINTECRPYLKFIQKQTCYNPDVILNKRIVDKIVKLGVAHVFLRVWKSVAEIDYLQRENLPAFKNLQTILSVLWNCSDKSAQLCDSLVRCGVVQLFLSELGSDKLLLADLNDENLLYLVKAYLGLLHNIVRLCSDSRKIFRTANAVEILQLYLKSEKDLVKTKSYLILSYIINEDENDLINATDENIEFILKILKDALESDNHFTKRYAFWASEIICGLNHLAVNDSNKMRMGRLGALSLYIKLLQNGNLDEQNLGSAGLWILAFKEENKRLLKQEPGCIEALKSLAANSPHESIRRAARGALWVVKNTPDIPVTIPQQQQQQREQVEEAAVRHVMISYHWGHQEIMVQVKDRLRNAGYKVWMDVDNMSGSTLEAMALAVERSSVVVLCMSQGYKDSPSCRTEAEYTYRLRKDIIPLLLQPNFNPDGWLGMMVGTRLYFDFSSKENLGHQMPRLMREIGDRGLLRSRERTISGRSSDTCPSESGDGASSCQLVSSTSITSLHSYVSRPRVDLWPAAEVKTWLENHNLQEISERLPDLDGSLLCQYHKMLQNAPGFFYHTLEDTLKLNLILILKFTKALESLKL